MAGEMKNPLTSKQFKVVFLAETTVELDEFVLETFFDCIGALKFT